MVRFSSSSITTTTTFMFVETGSIDVSLLECSV
jgi:hypothetical protein